MMMVSKWENFIFGLIQNAFYLKRIEKMIHPKDECPLHLFLSNSILIQDTTQTLNGTNGRFTVPIFTIKINQMHVNVKDMVDFSGFHVCKLYKNTQILDLGCRKITAHRNRRNRHLGQSPSFSFDHGGPVNDLAGVQAIHRWLNFCGTSCRYSKYILYWYHT